MKEFRKVLIYFVIILFLLYGAYLLKDKIDPIKEPNKPNVVELEDAPFHIYFMDVGEADSTLIRYKDTNILIDGGNTVDGKKLVHYYKSIGVDHFNLVVGTHAHEDHIGGFNFLLRKFPIQRFIMPNVSAEWKSYSNMKDAMEEKHISLEDPFIGQTFDYDDLHLEVLWLDHNKEDHNMNSIVLKVVYLNTSYLLMSDAGVEIENNLLDSDIDCDVLKVGHHGSNHSTSAVFLNKVTPRDCIISVGKDNDYGFPKQVTLDKLERVDCSTYRTDINHTIHLMSDGENISYEFLDTDTNGGDLNDN